MVRKASSAATATARVRLDVQGDERQSLADLLRPVFGENHGAALAVDLRDGRANHSVMRLMLLQADHSTMILKWLGRIGHAVRAKRLTLSPKELPVQRVARP